MIFRLSHKLAKKITVPVPKTAPADPNPFADWSGHLFTADRTQYLILTNTPSLYSTVINGRGIPDDSQRFCLLTGCWIKEVAHEHVTPRGRPQRLMFGLFQRA